MGRYGNYPKTLDDCFYIDITQLKKWGYLKLGCKSGVLTWSRHGQKQASINIKVDNGANGIVLNLDYRSNKEPRNYNIRIEAITSNLNKGLIYYFICPQTKKKCRKLYLHDGYFLHRTSFKLMYEKQLESKKNRDLFKVFEKVVVPDSVYEERYKKYFKTHYRGKPTKRYLKLQHKIDVAESYPPDTFERLLKV